MKLDYSRVRDFIGRLKIRDKRKQLVPCIPNPCQDRFLTRLEVAQDEGRPPWFIIDKSRRVGISTICLALLNVQACAMEAAEARVMAHTADTYRILLDIAKIMHQSITFPGYPDGLPEEWRKSRLLHYGPNNDSSKMTVQTAKTGAGGRGGGFTALLADEAAYYEQESVFLSLLPAIPREPNFFVFIPSTANGQDGTGQAFYETFMKAHRHESDFEAFFIAWFEDPTCLADPEILKRPTFEENLKEEKEIRSQYKLSEQQLAWRRNTLMNECDGLLAKLHQEFPISFEESFIASGNPTFEKEEIDIAQKGVCKPKWNVNLVRKGDHVEASGRGPFKIWEMPKQDHSYYLGADAARGSLHGDFAACCVINGTTGEQVASFAERANVDECADLWDKLGRFYNNAMMTIETSCNLGNTVQQRLVKDYHYPTFYRWRSRDDRVALAISSKPSIGWETTARTRHMLVHHFRISLREGDIVMHDAEFVSQMRLATWTFGMRWDVERGHDDVFMAGTVAWIARIQWPPRKFIPRSAIGKKEPFEGTLERMNDVGPIATAHLDKVQARGRAEDKHPNQWQEGNPHGHLSTKETVRAWNG